MTLTLPRPVVSRPRIVAERDGGVFPALYLNAPTTDTTYSGLAFLSTNRALVISNGGKASGGEPPYSDAHLGLAFVDCEFDGDGAPGVKWGARLYDVVRGRFERCHFHDIELEHGAYLNTAGGVYVRACRFNRIGAQALQCVWRAPGFYPPDQVETAHPELADPSAAIHVEDVIATNCGKLSGIGRAGFALSFFGGPERIELVDILLRSEQPDFQAHGGTFNSFGCIMVEHRSRAVFENIALDYRRPDRALVQLSHVQDVRISALQSVHPGVLRLNNCARIELSGIEGPVQLQVDGKVEQLKGGGFKR